MWDLNPGPSQKNISWTLIPFHCVKCPMEKNSAPPEMAGVPLPSCSGVRAIPDPQQGPTDLFLHPVPYAENVNI